MRYITHFFSFLAGIITLTYIQGMTGKFIPVAYFEGGVNLPLNFFDIVYVFAIISVAVGLILLAQPYGKKYSRG